MSTINTQYNITTHVYMIFTHRIVPHRNHLPATHCINMKNLEKNNKVSQDYKTKQKMPTKPYYKHKTIKTSGDELTHRQKQQEGLCTWKDNFSSPFSHNIRFKTNKKKQAGPHKYHLQ